MHDWLPTGHMRQLAKEGTYCPGCDEKNETLRHVWQCPTPRMIEKQITVMISARKIGKKKRIPQHILEDFCHGIQCEMDGEANHVRETHDKQIRVTIQAQQNIGVAMLRGFLTKGWMGRLD